MKYLILVLLVVSGLAAEDAPKGATAKHLTAEQQRDFWKLIAEANAAQSELAQTPAAIKARLATDAVSSKAQELQTACGGEMAKSKDGNWDCKPVEPPKPADEKPKP